MTTTQSKLSTAARMLMGAIFLVFGANGFLQLRIWIGDEDHPLHLRAQPGADLHALARLLADKLA